MFLGWNTGFFTAATNACYLLLFLLWVHYPQENTGQGAAPFTTAATRLSRAHPSMPRIYSSVKHSGRWLVCIRDDTNHYFKQPRGVQRVKGVSFLPTSSFNSIFKGSSHCNSKLYAEWFAAMMELTWNTGWGWFLPRMPKELAWSERLVSKCLWFRQQDLGPHLWKLALYTLYMGI